MKITIIRYSIIFLSIIVLFTLCKNNIKGKELQKTTTDKQQDSLSTVFEYADNNVTIKIVVDKQFYFGTNNLEKPTLFEKPIIQFCKNQFKIKSEDIYDLDTNKITLMKITENTYYVVLRITEFVLNDKYHVFKIYKCNSLIDNIINVGYFEDVDNDGFIEIGGWKYLDSYNAKGDSSLYYPILLYEINDDFHIDTLASKTYIEMKYHTFLGLNKKDTVLKVYEF